jgi:sulfite reductase beta subunit-like hemoprotein
MNDVGLQARIVDGKRGFRMIVGGGLGPLPVEAQLLDEFVPEELLVHRCEAVVRVFNEYGNRKNRNTARLKFVVRERGFEWVREQIDRAYAEILANGGIEWPEMVPEGFGGYQSNPAPLGNGALLPVVNSAPTGDPRYDAWLDTNVKPQKQTGYAAVVVRVEQGNMTADQFYGMASLASTAGDGLIRIMIEQNLLLAYIPLARLPQVYRALDTLGLAEPGARQIDDVLTCPGAYSCNLALTKTMNLGEALSHAAKRYDDPQVKRLSIKASGCPNACGQHWTGDIGFYGNARKIDGKEVPYYQMLLGGGYDEDGSLRYALAIQSVPARLAPAAMARILDHFIANRNEGETFRQYVLRYKVETFRAMTAEFAKPADLFPEIYQDWGDDEAFSLQLGRGECAA